MDRNYKIGLLSSVTLVLCFCLLSMNPAGIPSLSYAQEAEEQQEDDVTSRGIRGQLPRSSMERSRVMKKTLPSSQRSSGSSDSQIQALQKQVRVLQAQVNALRSVIQVSNGTTTLHSKVIRLQGETVTIKSLKEGIALGSKKTITVEANRDVRIKAQTHVDIRAGAELKLKGNAMARLQGPILKLNNGSSPIANLNSQVVVPPVGGIGKIIKGSPTVLVP